MNVRAITRKIAPKVAQRNELLIIRAGIKYNQVNKDIYSIQHGYKTLLAIDGNIA